jgi:hypothetical protein
MEELIGYAVYNNATDAGYMVPESVALNYPIFDYWMAFYLGHQADAAAAPTSGSNYVNGNYLDGATDLVEANYVIQGTETNLLFYIANGSNAHNAIVNSIAESEIAFVQFNSLELPLLVVSNEGRFELLSIVNLTPTSSNGFNEPSGIINSCPTETVNLEVYFTGLNSLFPFLDFGTTGLDSQVIGSASLAPNNDFADNSYILSNVLNTEKDYLVLANDGIKLNSLVVDYALSSNEISIGIKSVCSELNYGYKHLTSQGKASLTQNFAQLVFSGDYKETLDNNQSAIYVLGKLSTHPLAKHGTNSLIYSELSYPSNFNSSILRFGFASNMPLRTLGRLAFYQGIKNLYPNKDFSLRSTLIGLEQQGLIKDATIRPQGQLFPFKRW